MKPPAVINDNIYALSPEKRREMGIEELPGDLKEALEAFRSDEVLCTAFGEPLVSKFLDFKEKETKEFATTVHPWELEKYVNV